MLEQGFLGTLCILINMQRFGFLNQNLCSDFHPSLAHKYFKIYLAYNTSSKFATCKDFLGDKVHKDMYHQEFALSRLQELPHVGQFEIIWSNQNGIIWLNFSADQIRKEISLFYVAVNFI